MTRPAVYLLVWSAIMWGAAMVFQVEVFFILAALGIATELISLVLLINAGCGVSLTRSHASTIRQGDAFVMEFSLTTTARLPQGPMLIADENPGCGEVGAPIIWLSGQRGGETTTLRYTCEMTERGQHTLGPVFVRCKDPLGFFERCHALSCPGRLLVLPSWERISHLRLTSKRRSFLVGVESTAMEGEGQDFFGVREYQPGDSLRQVHWQTTARLNRPMIRQFEHESRPNVALFVDSDAREWSVEYAAARIDRTVAVACSIAVYTLDSGAQVSCYAPGQATPGLALQGGETQKQLVLRFLADVQPANDTGAAKALRQITGQLSGRDTLVAVLAMLSREVVGALSSFAYAGGSATVFLVSEAGETKISAARYEENVAGYIEGLKAFDVSVVRVSKAGSLDRAIHAWMR